MTSFLPFFRRQVALPQVAGRAEELNVVDVVGAAERNREDMIFVKAPGGRGLGDENGVAAIVRAEAVLTRQKALNLGKRMSTLKLGVAMSVTSTALKDTKEWSVFLRPLTNGFCKALSVLFSIDSASQSNRFGVLGLIRANLLNNRFAVAKVRLGLDARNAFGVAFSGVGLALSMTGETLFTLGRTFTKMVVLTGNACVVMRQTALARLGSGDNGRGVVHAGHYNMVPMQKSRHLSLGVAMATS